MPQKEVNVIVVFQYNAVNTDGVYKKGIVKGNTQKEAINILRKNGYLPINIKAQGIFQREINLNSNKKINTHHLSLFCRQFYIILNSGISIREGLGILKNQVKDKNLKIIISDVYIKIENGYSLSECFKLHAQLPPIFNEILTIGEKCGKIDLALRELSDYFEKQYKQSRKVKKAISYPMMLSVTAIITLIVIVSFVIPKFLIVFDNMNIQFPLSTRLIIISSKFIKNNYIYILLSLLCVVGTMKFLYHKKACKRFFDFAVFYIPVVGVLVKKRTALIIIQSLNMLLKSGITLVDSLNIIENNITNLKIKEKLHIANIKICKGESLSKNINDLKVFSEITMYMLQTGEKSGDMLQILDKACEVCEDEIEILLEKSTYMLQPFITVLISIFVFFIILAVVQPMNSLYENIGNLY